MDRVCIYLRKSRKDEELERELGQGETLAKHRKALLGYAKDRSLNIVNIYEELVSGESILFRPEMQKLLDDVQDGLYDAVLVMDIDRLGRGDMEDQGRIIKIFKTSRTKIITLSPEKVYDLNLEMDEEQSEFKTFFARMEYRSITRRMQGGRVRSVANGNYIAAAPPYGYGIKEAKTERYLVPHPEQAEVVKLVFDLYANKNYGCARIADYLNSLGYRSYTGKEWERSAIAFMIKNQVYAGKIVWKKKCIKRSATPGKSKDTYTRPQSEWIVVKGKHDPLVDEETFNKAQEIMAEKYHVPYQLANGVVNSLAGLIYCGICGNKMVRRPYQNGRAHIICIKKCGNKSSRVEHVEQKLLDSIRNRLEALKLSLNDKNAPQESNNISIIKKGITALEKELEGLNDQRTNIHNLLEKGLYDEATFLERSKYIAQKSAEVKCSLEKAGQELKEAIAFQDARKNIIPMFEKVLKLYESEENAEKKNLLLKNIVEKAVYIKSKDKKGDDFELETLTKF